MVGLFANLMRVTLNMSALAALILFCTPLLKKRYSAGWRYWVWMVITVRLLIPFQMPAIELPDLSGPFQSAISAAWTAPQDSKTQISQEAEGQTRQDAPTLQEQSNQIEQQKTSESSSLAEKKAQTVQIYGRIGRQSCRRSHGKKRELSFGGWAPWRYWRFAWYPTAEFGVFCVPMRGRFRILIVRLFWRKSKMNWGITVRCA